LLLLQARIVQRIGFPAESDVMLSSGTAILGDGGSQYQRWLAVLNTGRVTLDRGSAVEAVPLLERVFARAEDVAGLAGQADAAAWLARAQFLRGRPSEGLELVEAARDLAEDSDTSGPIFLGHMARAEGAIRFAAFEEGLGAADAMLEYVHRQLPKWENAARYLRARALLGLGQLSDAGDEIERALERTPEGINGWRWRLRIEAFGLSVLAVEGGEWPQQRAEDLTDELLQGQWLDIAAELMALRARVESDQELASQAAALALKLGIPTTAATAIEAGDLWSDPNSAAVAARVKETAHHVPREWHEAWSERPEVAAALAAPDVVDEELTAAAASLQADLDSAMIAAGLADPATALSPAQRRVGGLVRRRPGGIQRGALLLGAAAAVVILAIGGGFVASRVFAPDEESAAVAIEDTQIPVPEAFGKTWETLGGNQARTGVSPATGVSDLEGHYWVNEESQSPFVASPIVLGQTVVVPSQDGDVYFMEQRNGSTARVWPTGTDFRETAAGVVVTAPSIAGGTSEYLAYLPGTDGLLHVFDVQSATEVDRLSIDTCCTPALDPATGLLWAGDQAGVLHAIDAATATVGESLPVSEERNGIPVTTAVTFDGGFLYFGMGDELWQFDVTSRQARECETVTDSDFLTPVVSEGVVYAANRDRSIHTFDAATCVWLRDIRVDEVLPDAPAVVDGIVYQPHQFGVTAYYYGTKDDVDALIGPDPDAEESEDDDVVKWRTVYGRSEMGAVNSSPLVAGNLLYVAAQNGHVYALDRTSPALGVVWNWDAGGRIANSVAVVDQAVYVATTGGRVIAIGGQEGVALAIPTTTSPPTTVPPVESSPGAG
jgi:outer membrane protein assembly factor BamB/tetratricopeptide (TPR) repeat protein